jgi:hypothetical protein
MSPGAFQRRGKLIQVWIPLRKEIYVACVSESDDTAGVSDTGNSIRH